MRKLLTPTIKNVKTHFHENYKQERKKRLLYLCVNEHTSLDLVVISLEFFVVTSRFVESKGEILGLGNPAEMQSQQTLKLQAICFTLYMKAFLVQFSNKR